MSFRVFVGSVELISLFSYTRGLSKPLLFKTGLLIWVNSIQIGFIFDDFSLTRGLIITQLKHRTSGKFIGNV